MFTSRKHTMDLSTTLVELQAGRLELYDVHNVRGGMTAWVQELDNGRTSR